MKLDTSESAEGRESGERGRVLLGNVVSWASLKTGMPQWKAKGPFTRDAASRGIAARLPPSLVVEAFCAVEAVFATAVSGRT